MWLCDKLKNEPPIERRSVTSHYHGIRISGRQQQGAKQRQRQWELQKKQQVYIYLAKQQLCTCITLFCTFPSRRCTTATWNFLYVPALGSRWTQHNFFFSKQIKWNWIRLMKFVTVWIHFLSDVFGLLSSKHFATVATWRKDFSSLLHQF